jgi:hypothetical protein
MKVKCPQKHLSLIFLYKSILIFKNAIASSHKKFADFWKVLLKELFCDFFLLGLGFSLSYVTAIALFHVILNVCDFSATARTSRLA